MKLFRKDRPRYSFALMLSLALHIVGFTYIYKSVHEADNSSSVAAHKVFDKSHSVKLDTVKFITQKQLQAIKNLKNKQIVATELNGKKEAPTNSRYAGETDQTFDRQTMAARNGSFKKAGLGNKDGSPTEQARGEEPAAEAKKTAKTEKKNSKTPAPILSLSELGSIHISKVEDDEKIKAEALHEQAMNRKLAADARRANAQGIEKGSSDTTGLAQNNDFVEEVPLGDMTNLNTTEFKYYGFYQRIRQKLEQYWGNSIQSKAKNLYKSGRRLPGSENLITAIMVTIDDRGNIVDIKIEGTSGIRELDQAAIESFNKAGPFPNPPKGLLVGGKAVIQWGFVVKS